MDLPQNVDPTAELVEDAGASRDPTTVRRKKTLLALRKMQTEYFFKVADEISELAGDVANQSHFDLTAWLESEVGFSQAEAKAYVKFNRIYGRDDERTEIKETFQRARTSPETIRALVNCTVAARADCLARIAAGNHVDARRVGQIRRARLAATTTAETTAKRLRRALLREAEASLGKSARIELETRAGELLTLLKQRDFAGDVALEIESASDKAALEGNISEKSAEVFSAMRTLFPGKGNDRRIDRIWWERDGAGRSLANAWTHLWRMTNGRESGSSAIYQQEHEGARACIEFLAGKRWLSVRPANEANNPPAIVEEPKFIDIDAGFGATALGLQAAGFQPATLFVGTAHAMKAIRANRPYWKRDWHNVKADYLKALEKFADQDIDLLTSGLPWHHYKHGRDRAVQRALDAISIVKPKTFMFEGRSADVRNAEIREKLVGLGYAIKWHSVDVRRYGVRQEENRSVLVGSRVGMLNDLSFPLVTHPRQRGIGHAIGDLLGKHEWDGTEDLSVREKFTKDIKDWTEKWKDVPAPQLPVGKVKKRKGDWARMNVDISTFAKDSPCPEKLMTGFCLTPAMLKRIQGIPTYWNTDGKFPDAAEELASAFPPNAAKMLGLAINSVLTGVVFDYDRAVCTPVARSSKNELDEFPARSISQFIVDRDRVFRTREETRRSELRHARYLDLQRASGATSRSEGSACEAGTRD